MSASSTPDNGEEPKKRDSDPEALSGLVADAYESFRSLDEGQVGDTYPVVAQANPAWFGLSHVTVTGQALNAGDSDQRFPLMSVAKPFTFALVCDQLGVEEVHRLVGMNATGRPYNSLEAVERAPQGRNNPMVNAGAIATAGLAPGGTVAKRWEFLAAGFAKFAGRELELRQDVVDSVRATNQRNRALALLMHVLGGMAYDPLEAVDVYTNQCCLLVSCSDLALMGATLANGGINPRTGDRVVSPQAAQAALTAMVVSGMYESSGDWLLGIGMPAKSGISGGLVVASPGNGAFAAYSPRVDGFGNTVRGQRAAEMVCPAVGPHLLQVGGQDLS